MALSSGRLSNLITDIYPKISSHLPLHAIAPTLLSLGLTNHYNARVVLPILNSRLILRSNEKAIPVLQKLIKEHTFGVFVIGVHLLFEQLDVAEPLHPSLDALMLVQEAILGGHLPNLRMLEINFHAPRDLLRTLFPLRYTRPNPSRFRKEFFLNLREQCPLLTGLILRGVDEDQSQNMWIERSGLSEIPKVFVQLSDIHSPR